MPVIIFDWIYFTKLFLFFLNFKVNIIDGILRIKLERDTQRAQMLTGGYVTNAEIQRGGKYTVCSMVKPLKML